MTDPDKSWFLERVGVTEPNYFLSNTMEIIRIGRMDSNDIHSNDKVCVDKHVSKKHLVLERHGMPEDWRNIKWSVRNLSETNGTYINQEKIYQSCFLEPDDLLGLGNPKSTSMIIGQNSNSYTFVYSVKPPNALRNPFEKDNLQQSNVSEQDSDMESVSSTSMSVGDGPGNKTSRESSPSPLGPKVSQGVSELVPSGAEIPQSAPELIASGSKLTQSKSGLITVKVEEPDNLNESILEKVHKSDAEGIEDRDLGNGYPKIKAEGLDNRYPRSEEGGMDVGDLGNSSPKIMEEGLDNRYPKIKEQGLDNRYPKSEEGGMEVGESTNSDNDSIEGSDHFMDTGEDNKKSLVVKIKLPTRYSFTRLYAKSLNCATFFWEPLLDASDFIAAPVSTFHHAPLADSCKKSVVGMEVRVRHTDGSTLRKARIDKMLGYIAMLRLVDSSDDAQFWLNILSPEIHYPTGWCDLSITSMLQPANFHPKESVWKIGMKVECIDRKKIGQVKVATVAGITGKRLHLIYTEKEELSEEFWCHQDSSLLHPVGWARSVGHPIQASREYREENNLADNSLSVNLQPSEGFTKGMKLEVVDPIHPGNICVATVMKVLNGGWIMVRIDGSDTASYRESRFCYHETSKHIFPPGFCEMYDISLDIPDFHIGEFDWKDYLKNTKSIPAPEELFRHRNVKCKHKFVPGMKVEAADLIQPDLICPATIKKVAGRLLKVGFDGWEEGMDQWMDCRSLDLYPVGWAEVVGHILQEPGKVYPVGWAEVVGKEVLSEKPAKRKNGLKEVFVVSKRLRW